MKINTIKYFVIITIFYLFISPMTSLAQSSYRDRLKILYQKYRELEGQKRHHEAIKYAEMLVVIGEKAFGKEHYNIALFLKKLGALYTDTGQYTRAVPIYRRELVIEEKLFGSDHPDVAMTLNNLAFLFNSLGNYREAVPILKRVVGITEKAFGFEHPIVASNLNSLGDLYNKIGEYAKAELLIKRALTINEKVFGYEHTDVALSLNNLGTLYHSMGKYKEAGSKYEAALTIMEKLSGPTDINIASILTNLAGLYRLLGEYSRAETLFIRSLKIKKEILGPEHGDVAISLSGLGVIYYFLGQYTKAISLFKQAETIIEKTYDSKHPLIATNLTNMAPLLVSLGEYSDAEIFLKRALEIRKDKLGPNHPDVGITLNNLAALYKEIGDYSKAINLYKRSYTIFEQIFGSVHLNVALSLNNLAGLYRVTGNYSYSEELYKKSLVIKEKILGQKHPSIAKSLNNLAGLYMALGDYHKAEIIYKQTILILEKVYGQNHIEMANSLNNLAVLSHEKGDFKFAEELYNRALSIYYKSLDNEHPDIANSLSNLAFSYISMHDFKRAHEIFKKAQNIDIKFIDEIMSFTSEKQKLQFLFIKNIALYAYLNHIVQNLIHKPSARVDALNIWLKRKGIILKIQKRFQEALIYSGDPLVIETFQELSRIRFKLSSLVFSGSGKGSIKDYKKKITDLKIKIDRLEARLSQLSENYALYQKIGKTDCMKIAESLPEETALIEFARIDVFNFKAKGKKRMGLPPHYIAFILHSGRGDKVEIVDLGKAEELERCSAELKRTMTSSGKNNRLKIKQSARRVYDLVFAPIKKKLEDVKEIFISPDGYLNLIPFEVLQGPDGKFLIENYTFNYLVAGRDLLGFGEIQERGDKALLMGDPDFDLGIDEKIATLKNLALGKQELSENLKRSLDMRDMHFSRLPGSKEEVKSIFTLLGEEKAELFIGKEAIEEVLTRDRTPSILHLATHGFFLRDLQPREHLLNESERGMQKVFIMPKPSEKLIKIENPLLRSGIALAGANNALRSGDLKISDGIVTAEKILGLRLRGTDMVVLSACETGLGEVKTGEGVFGLRRAFIQAGTRSIVMSMWSVPDRETMELMINFYKNIDSGKMNRCKALRKAILEEMKIVKGRYGHTNPLFWGAFVFVGEP